MVGQEIELRIEPGAILLGRVRQARAGWDEQFAWMAAHDDNALLDEAPQTSAWDERDWVW
jgi:hypothetical protein